MKTQIFENYSAFLKREDKTLNGVSQRFADTNPDFKKDNKTNEACWNCSDCSRCSRLRLRDNIKTEPSVDSNTPPRESIGFPNVPVIENIHTKILEATSKENALNMRNWHTCDTTHCRAGWAVFLAGDEGKRLEDETTTLFAAMQIYKASSNIRVSPVRFFETNEVAMADIKACAEAESKLNTNP